MEVRRLKNELERMNEKQRESVGEQSRRLAEVSEQERSVRHSRLMIWASSNTGALENLVIK